MTCGIYKIVNKRTGETYIGQSQNIEKRWKKHENDLKNNKHNNHRIQKDYDNGDSFLFTILEKTEFDKNTLNSLEIEYIIGYNTFNEGYNQTPGGNYDKLKGKLDLGGGRLPLNKYTPIKEINKFKDNYELDNLENSNFNNLNLKNEKLLKLLMKNIDIEKEKEQLRESEKHYYALSEQIKPSKINLNKINYFLETEKWSEALEICEEYLTITYDNEIILNKGICLYHLKRYEESLDILNISIQNKETGKALKYKSLIYIKLNLLEKAYKCIIKAKKLEENDIEINLIKKELEEKSELEEEVLINYLNESTTNKNIINIIKPLIINKKIIFKTEIDDEIKRLRRTNIIH